MAMPGTDHYLKTELYELVRKDPAIFEFLQAGSLDGIWYWDVERQEQEWMSPRFKEVFGYRDDEIPNTPDWWQANIHPDDLAVALDNFGKHLKDPSHPYDQIVRYRHRDGGTVWVRCRGLAIRDDDGKPIRLLGCHTDVTALKRAEEDLRRQANELREARDSAEHANRAKSTFLANVSHEIRTPLNAVIGSAELLGETDLTADQQRHVEAIHVSAEALLDIINDILDFSKLEAGRIEADPSPFRLRERIEAWVRSLAPRLHEKPVRLVTEVAPDVPDALVGDERLLRQVLANLLSNAMKFTAAGRIALRVRIEARDGDDVALRFEVEDTGIGIPPEKQQVIFEEFVQGDASTTRHYGGTGLGLAIAARLVDVLDGRIGLVSQPDEGSTFHFTARFAQPAFEAAGVDAGAEPVSEAAVLGPLRILVVEDSVANQQVAIGMLEKRGHTVDVAASGAAAVEATSDASYDVVLMDLQMPGMDGYEATRRIRGREAADGAAPMAIVALTARASRGSEAYCLNSGFDGYLLKPYRSRELLDVIAAAVGIERVAAPADGGAEADTRPAAAPEPGARLDWKAALDAVDGDSELLRRVIGGYLGQQTALVDELRAALTGNDPAVARRAAHTIAGSLRLFEEARVVALAHELEDRARDGDLEGAVRVWTSLEPELNAVETELRAWIGD
ncbi:MAG: PAS domain-containing protein [Acidobacteria bacterium]|nr:PAS domain-containing protein [Acidobacteriota bacterium]